MSHFNYALRSQDAVVQKSKFVGFKKNEAFDFLIANEIEGKKQNPQMYSNYVYGCHCESYEFWTKDFSITSNAECNSELGKELTILSKEIQTRRQQLNEALQSYPFGTRIEKSCARIGALLQWFGKTFGFILSLLLFVWIWWIFTVLEVLFCYPFYCYLDGRDPGATLAQKEEWFHKAIISHPEFDAENLDSFVIESLQQICSKLNERFHTSLRPHTYQEQEEVASHDGGSNCGWVHHFTAYYDEFLIKCEEEEESLSAAV